MPNDSRQRFSDRVDAYLRYRPGYPEAAIDHLRSRGIGPDSRVADVGAGTGILTTLLLPHAGSIIAVEPNGPMREAAARQFAGSEKVSVIDGSAEESGLPDASVDAVVVGQAFHWFDHGRALSEFRRILKPGGLLAVLWNSRLSDTDFLREYDRLLRKWGTDYNAVNHQQITAADMAPLFDRGFQKDGFPNVQHFDLEGLKGRLYSSSYVPLPGEAGHDELMEGMESAFRLHNREGVVAFRYTTEVYSGYLD